MSIKELPDTGLLIKPQWQQGQLVEVMITDLNDTGDGVKLE